MRGEPAYGATGPSEQAARTARALFCVATSEPPCFELREIAMRRIPDWHVLGRRLLTLKGAGHFPLVLGNVVAGTVEDVGPEVTSFTAGTALFGVLPSGRNGAHATHVAMPHGVPSPDAGEPRRGGGLAALFHDRVASP
jgi:hypothetical protein